MPNICENVEQLQTSFHVDGNVKSCSHVGKHFDNFMICFPDIFNNIKFPEISVRLYVQLCFTKITHFPI